ncbi:MAG: hypothetical protein K0Q63_2571 [Paenibacillus sp.]|jgi:hypothetical protein|nr:hypothetical protein [Paenibacillus sp.]
MAEERRAGYPRTDIARRLPAVCDRTLGNNVLDKNGRFASALCKKA